MTVGMEQLALLPAAEPASVPRTAAGEPDSRNGGSPVRVWPSLSPSRAADFMTCPLLYRFRAIDRLPEPPSRAAIRGTLVHAVLERLFDLPAAERTVERARALVVPQWNEMLDAEPDRVALPGPLDAGAETTLLLEAEQLVARFFALEDPRCLEPADRELYVEATLASGLRLRGYVDRLDRAAGSGELRIVDYKTGTAPPPGHERRAMFQLRFYALVLWRCYGRVPRSLQLVYLGSGEVLRYEPDEADLMATERLLVALWRAIERSARTGDWRARPSAMCDWCAHQSLCPAFGGTPPPYQPTAEATSAADEAPSPRMSPVDA